MNKKIMSPIIAGVVAAIIVSVLLITENQKEIPSPLSIDYEKTNENLQSNLATNQISMSSPLKLKGELVDQYCTFFTDQNIQESIEYCTSTELKDSQGNFLGNIHIVGSSSRPQYVIGVIQANPHISQLDDIKVVFEKMIESSVCDCWDEEKPGGFESVSAWIAAANSYHLEAKRITSKSEINNLAQKALLLEITTNTEGYLWKFIIST